MVKPLIPGNLAAGLGIFPLAAVFHHSGGSRIALEVLLRRLVWLSAVKLCVAIEHKVMRGLAWRLQKNWM